MVLAYVMVKARTGDADRLRDEIAAVDGIVEAHIVAGDFDFIAKAEVDSPGDVRDVVASTVRNLEGVEDTETYLAM